MLEDPNLNVNKYERPTHILLTEMRELHEEFAKLTLDFSSVCDRMESCAKRINDYGRIVSKALFADFAKAGVRLGNFIRFTDAEDPDALYLVSGIDSEGFWLKALPLGDEYQLKVLDNRDRLQKIRYYTANSMRVQKAREQMMTQAIAEEYSGDINDALREESALDAGIESATVGVNTQGDSL